MYAAGHQQRLLLLFVTQILQSCQRYGCCVVRFERRSPSTKSPAASQGTLHHDAAVNIIRNKAAGERIAWLCRQQLAAAG
jgi:hypothetical protein